MNYEPSSSACKDPELMGSPSGNRGTARQEDGLIFAPTEGIYLLAKKICVCQDFFSGQLSVQSPARHCWQYYGQ